MHCISIKLSAHKSLLEILLDYYINNNNKSCDYLEAVGNQDGVDEWREGLSNNTSHWAGLRQNQLELQPTCSQESIVTEK